VTASDGVSVRHNWSASPKSAGGVIGQTAGMRRLLLLPGIEFLGDSYRGKAPGPEGDWFTALLVFLARGFQDFFIVATDA